MGEYLYYMKYLQVYSYPNIYNDKGQRIFCALFLGVWIIKPIRS